MRVAVNGIPTAGATYALGPAQQWALAAATEALDGAPDELSGQLTLRPASDRGLVHVVGEVRASRPATCDRCGEPCPHGVEVDVQLLYAPEARDDESFDGGELELQAEDLDVGWYAGGSLDLAAVLGEAVALELSPRIRCADVEECDKRTADLLEAAGRSGSPGHPAFAALRDKFA